MTIHAPSTSSVKYFLIRVSMAMTAACKFSSFSLDRSTAWCDKVLNYEPLEGLKVDFEVCVEAGLPDHRFYLLELD